MMKVLFLAANPTTSSPLRLAAEQRAVQLRIESSAQRADLELTSVFAAKPSDLLVEMNKIRPQIVHFSGHGAASGELVLESETGEARAVTPRALKAVFEAFRPELQVVVLNACYSSVQADAFVEVVDAVIGMKDTISDSAAIAFASAFYSALGFGRSVSDAFKQATTAILLEEIDDADVPTLLHRPESDPSKLTVATSRQHLLAVDPSLPLRLRELLLSGTRLIVLDDPKSSRDDLVYFELVLRQSKTTYVVQASLSATVEKTAEALAGAVISADARLLYEWELVEATAKEEPLTPFHTLEMAGIKSGSKLMLLGNHKTPVWAPAFSPRRRF